MRSRLIGTVLLLLTAGAAHGNWVSVYQTDFSTDPGWTTNNPASFHWNPADGTYYIKMENVNYGGYYSHYNVGHHGGSFKLDYDIRMPYGGYASGMRLGMFDSDMETEFEGSYVDTLFCTEDRGRTIMIESINSGDVLTPEWSASLHWNLNTWYDVSMEYFDSTGSFTTTIRDGITGDLVGSKSIHAGPFSTDMSYIGSTNLRLGTFQVPGAYSIAYIDNVEFYDWEAAPVPVPGAVLLGALGLGFAGFLGRRKAFQE